MNLLKSNIMKYKVNASVEGLTLTLFFFISEAHRISCFYERSCINSNHSSSFVVWFPLHRRPSRGEKTPAHMGDQTAFPLPECCQPNKVKTPTVELTLNTKHKTHQSRSSGKRKKKTKKLARLCLSPRFYLPNLIRYLYCHQ